jgi:hypothetical protein
MESAANPKPSKTKRAKIKHEPTYVHWQCVGCQDTGKSPAGWLSPLCNCTGRAWCAKKQHQAGRCTKDACRVDINDEAEGTAYTNTDEYDVAFCLNCDLPV